MGDVRRGAKRSRSLPLLTRARERGRPARSATSRLRVAGLFAGIGGIELGLHRAGHETVLLCESDPGAVAVLEARFPGVPIKRDVCRLQRLPAGTDLVAAGFPCQDLSQAGMTRGLRGVNSSLVSEVFRLLETERVPWVLFENVRFMLQLAKGSAVDYVLRSLEELGYSWAYRVVDTRSFGLPQRRQRVFILASLDGDPRQVLLSDDVGAPPEEPSTDGLACGFYWTEGIRGLGWAIDGIPTLKGGSGLGIPSPPAIVLPSGKIVKPDIRDAERLQGFPPQWTKPAEAVARPTLRWKMIGNAVSVPVAKWIGQRLLSPRDYVPDWDEPLGDGERWPDAAWGRGDGAYASRATMWPVKRARSTLVDFLRFEPDPLSEKATAGFLARTERSSLRFPDGFLDAVSAHLARMTNPR